MIITILAATVCAGFAVAVYVRLAPTQIDRWHRDPMAQSDQTYARGVRRVVPATGDAFARLDTIIRATPRTDGVTGSVASGMITYVTRSRVWGFPDFTTVKQRDGRLEIHGRARFGQSDMGVNKARVDGWLAVLRGDG